MNPYVVLGALAGAAAAGGLVCLILWIRGLDPNAPSRSRTSASKVMGSGVSTERRSRRRRIAIGVPVCLLVWFISGWPIGGITCGLAVYFLPEFFMVKNITARRIDRLEGLEEWVRRLADSMAAGGSPTATIVRSADRAPEAIRSEVRELASRLATPRWDRIAALRQFANQIDDSLGDIVGVALEISVSRTASDRVPAVLRAVADAAAEEVRGRRQIEVERTAPRNEARVLVIMMAGAVLLTVLFTNTAGVYGTPAGQVVIAILTALSGISLWMIRKLSLGEKTPRILSAADQNVGEVFDR